MAQLSAKSLRVTMGCSSLFIMAGLIALSVIRARGATDKSAGENLALGRPYTLDPMPNYPGCTDPDDLKQLTDGQHTVSYFWTQKSTVGWVRANPAIITIDLGTVQPIAGVAYNTAAGVAGVQWPEYITILVSEDRTNFYFAGELISLSSKVTPPPSGRYAVHCFRTEGLRTRGRYVAFLVSPTGPFTFVDEIEVYKGDETILKRSFEDKPFTDLKAFHTLSRTKFGMERRLREDVRSMRAIADRAGLPAEAKGKLLAELDALEREVPRLTWPPENDFKAILPLNATHERVFQLQARLWQALKADPISIWQAEPYGFLSHTQAPPQAKASVAIAMMQNEYRAGAFNVANAADATALARIQIIGLPGGTNPPYITVNEVLWTDTKGGIPVSAALKEIKQKDGVYQIQLPAGLTRQVWMTFHPTNIPPNLYVGKILVFVDNTEHTVPVTLQFYPLRFPDVPTLHLGGWDYTDSNAIFDIVPGNRDAVIAHLREHFVDSPWATPSLLPSGKYDAQGNMTAGPDTTRFDQWIDRWHNARQYCVFLDVKESFDGSPISTPQFAKKVGQWVTFWAKHAELRGVEPQRLKLLLVDEPTEVQDEIILAWATAIHAAKTGVKIWEDPHHKNPAAASQEMLAACDVLCPSRVTLIGADQSYRDFYLKRREQGTELALYSHSGPITTLDPYTYCRLQAWSCWQYGARSSYFWAFGDAGGGSSWNEYAGKRATFVPFFLDARSVTPAKHMEALREGVEDYEYLVMLRDEATKAEKSGVRSGGLDRARRLLSEAASRVCGAPGANAIKWAQVKDRTIADQVRIEILDALTTMQQESAHPKPSR